MKKDNVILRVDPALKEQFKRVCKEKDATMSEVLTGFMHEFVSHYTQQITRVRHPPRDVMRAGASNILKLLDKVKKEE